MPFGRRRRREEPTPQPQPKLEFGFENHLEGLGTALQTSLEATLGGVELRKESSVSQALFSKEVAIKKYVPALIEYARTGRMEISANGVVVAVGNIQRIRPTSDYLELDYTLNEKSGTYKVHYINEPMRSFMLGQWVTFAFVKARCNPVNITPNILYEDSTKTANFVWSDGPEVALRAMTWWIPILNAGRITSTKLRRIQFTPNEGNVDSSGLPGFFIPTLKWI